MRILAILMVMSMLAASCGDGSLLKDNSDDAGISGTVSKIWQNLGVGSAYAREESYATREEGGYIAGGRESVEPKADEMHAIISNQFLVNEIIGMDSSINDYAGLADDALNTVVNFSDSTRIKFPELVNKVHIADVRSLKAADFPHGIVLAIGYDSSKLVVSINVSAVNADGSYKVSDKAFSKVSFYKLSFIFERAAELQYRQAYVFLEGAKTVADVDPVVSAASMRVTQYLVDDPAIDVSKMKEDSLSLQKIVKTRYEANERLLVETFAKSVVNSLAGEPVYDKLGAVSKEVMMSALLMSLRRTPSFDILDSYAALLRTDTNIEVFLGDIKRDVSDTHAEIIQSVVVDVIQRLVDARLIVLSEAAPLLKRAEEVYVESR